MKTFFSYPISIYLIAGLACLAIMIAIDYLLGAEAKHLNAWVIVNKLIGNDIGIADSLAIMSFGLYGAAILTLVINSIFGIVLIQLLKGIIQLVHLIF
ncbi:MAG: hypothetical protein GY790_07700 [Bacteroidetes bacterium]|nr:hypothetical protein [Bacteroidota bacterium]